MTLNYRQLIKAGLKRIGFDLVRIKNNPRQTLLGLKTRPIQTIIDVGANTGQFAQMISQFFPNAALHCFEPLPGPFAQLEEWSKSQHGRVIPYNLALGDSDAEVEMYLHSDHTPSSSLLPTTKLNEQYYPFTKEQSLVAVRQTTLDAALATAQASWAPEILIKLDVQGYENRVIAGGSKVFSEASACILEVCLDGLYEEQARFPDLLMMLGNFGYQYVGNLDQVYADDGHCIYFDAVFIKQANY